MEGNNKLIRDKEAEQTANPKEENSYIHYAPAVRFGHSLASLEQNRNRSWTEIEMEARQQWEEEHERPWTEFKDIIQRAWDEVRVQFADDVETPKYQNNYDTIFRRHFEENYRDSQFNYRQYASAYHYGFDLAVDQRLHNKSWAEIEPEARKYWAQQSEARGWEDMKEAVYYAWNEVQNQIEKPYNKIKETDQA